MLFTIKDQVNFGITINNACAKQVNIHSVKLNSRALLVYAENKLIRNNFHLISSLNMIHC